MTVSSSSEDAPPPPPTATGSADSPNAPLSSGRPALNFAVVLLLTTSLVIFLATVIELPVLCRLPGLCGPIKAVDIAQGRLDTALPAPDGRLVIEQRLRPIHNGLSEIEFIFVRHSAPVSAEMPDSRFTIELHDDAGNLVAVRSLPTQTLVHNQVYMFQFSPQTGSAGREYTIRLIGNTGNPVSVWGYSLDVSNRSEFQVLGGDTIAQEIRFTSRYALLPADLWAFLGRSLAREGWWLALALAFVLLPGCMLLSIVRPYHWDWTAWWGVALAIGVATWPILWFWVSLAGGRWSGLILWSIFVVGWSIVGIRAVRTRPVDRTSLPGRAPPDRLARLISLLLVVLLGVSLAARLTAVRDQAFPPWVDSSRHALITAVMVEQEQTPSDYRPYLPVDHFPYHFGFHTIAASLVMMTGRELPDLLLYLGQLLNGLVPLTVYAAGWLVTRRRAVGLVAAFLVALPFFFPGYYATWGRMTQLSAMVVMPVLIALTWQLGRGYRRAWPIVGLLAAGLFLIHFRVFLFYLPLALLVGVIRLAQRRVWPLLKAAGLAFILVMPRLYQLLSQMNPAETFSQTLPGYNDFPAGYLTTGWERFFIGLAAVALGIVLVGLVLRRRWVIFPLVLVAWVAAMFLLLAGERLGLPETLLVNLNSMYITLFLPAALFLAIVAGELWRWIAGIKRYLLHPRVPGALNTAAGVSAGVALGLLVLFGWRQQINILNPQTILALPQDSALLAWADENLPPDAFVAVNAWQWLGTTWAGSDGGAWLVPLTGRRSTTPPIDYIYDPDLYDRVASFNEAAIATEDWSDPAAANWLRDQGITHVMVGTRGGYLDPAELSRNPSLEQLYSDDGGFVFAVRP